MSLPAWVKTGTVTGLTSIGGGGTAFYATGSYILFTPAITHLTKADLSATFVLEPQIGYVGADGDLHPATSDGAWDESAPLLLVATTGQTGTAGEVWYWKATPWVDSGGVRRSQASFAFNVAADTTTTIASQQPIPSLSPSSGYAKGDPGPAPNLTVGTVSTLAPGDDVTFGITGTTPNYVVDVGIPQGEPGAGGVDPTDVGDDIIVAVGQSNMPGHGTDLMDVVYLDPGSGRIKQWGGCAPWLGKRISGIDPIFFHENRPGSVSHVMQFTRDYIKTVPENRTAVIVGAAHSQTGFTTSSLVSPPVGYTHADGGGWDTTGGQGGVNLYEFAIAQANAALASGPNPSKNRIVAILWLQGESDAGALTQSQYAAKLDLLIAGLRSRITGAATVPFLVGQMLPQHIAAHSDFQAINAAHLDTSSRNTRCAFYYGPVGTQYANSTADTELHYNNAGQRLLGDSSWSAYPLAIANVLGTAPVPPTAVSVVQSGTSVIATVTRSAGRVTDYTVQYRRNGGSWTTLSHTATLDVTFTISSLTLGDVVDVRIATVNEQGTSAYTTGSVTLVHLPNAPTLGTPTHTATSISPVWTAAGSGDPATSFLVESGVHPAGGVYTKSVTVAAPATTGQVLGLLVDTSYDYRVTPINAAGSGTAVTGTVSTDNVGFLVTDVGVTPFACFSPARKLVSAYAGNCIKVRRSSDNTTQNIGYDVNGDCDVAAVLAFVGAGNGFIDTLYDNTANARHMTMATTPNQPQCVVAGVAVMADGRLAFKIDGSTMWLDGTAGLYAAGHATILTVCELDTAAVAANNLYTEGSNSGSNPQLYTLTRVPTGGQVGGQIIPDVGAGGTVTLANGSTVIRNSTLFQMSRVDTGTQDATWINSNVDKALTSYTRPSTSVTLNKARIGGLVKSSGSASEWQGTISEIAVFDVALTDPQRVAGEANQKSYYAIA